MTAASTAGTVLSRDRLPNDGPVTRILPRGALIPALVLLVLAAVAILAPALAPHDPIQPLGITTLNSHPPSLAYPFGTDAYSRDVLSRVMFGGRVSLAIGLLATIFTVIIGTLWGAIAGYRGGWVDRIMMRLVDAGMAIPRVLLVILIVALWQALPLWTLILVIGGTGWFSVSRLVRAQVQALRHDEYILAAESLGARPYAIFLRHMIPNLLPVVFSAASLEFAHVVVLEAGLSYLGLGVQPPAASWGNLIYEGSAHLGTLWWLSVFPGLMLAITSVAASALGEAYRRALDPRMVKP